MSKLACLLLSTILLSACGRSPTDLYRAYNLVPITRDSKGRVLPDLGAQNRLSMQSHELTYVYQVPADASPSPSASPNNEATDKTIAEDDAALPDDASSQLENPELNRLNRALEKLESALEEATEAEGL